MKIFGGFKYSGEFPNKPVIFEEELSEVRGDLDEVGGTTRAGVVLVLGVREGDV